MIEFIGEDRVLRAQQRFKQAAVCVEARGVKNRIVRAEELADFGFELFMDALGAADETDRRKTIAPFVERQVRRPDDRGMLRKSKIVVGAQIEERLGIADANARVLGRADDALVFVKPGLPDLAPQPDGI